MTIAHSREIADEETSATYMSTYLHYTYCTAVL